MSIMTQTDGPVRPTVSQLIRRPFKLNLPGPSHAPTASAPCPPPAEEPPATPASAVPPAGLAAVTEADSDARPTTQLSREQILDATAACLDAEGYDGTTIRKIAKRLDCAVGSIYRYFTDKRELLDTVVQGRFSAVLEGLASNATLQETTTAYIAAAVNRPEQYRLMFWLCAVGRAPDQPTVLPEVIERIIDGWAEQLGGRTLGQRHWGTLHGELMLGLHDTVAERAGVDVATAAEAIAAE